MPLALPGDGIDAVTEFRGDTAFPSRTNGRTETVRADKWHIRAGYPALRTSGNAIAHQIVHTVGVGLLFRRYFQVKSVFNIAVDLRHIRNGYRYGVALLGFRPILGGDDAGTFLVDHKAIHELSMRSAAGGVLSKENGIENSLDADTVKAVAILRHVIDGGDGVVQQCEAAAHIFDVSNIFRRRFVRDRSAVETQQDGGIVMLRAAGEQRADQRQRQDQRRTDRRHDPAQPFPGVLIRESGSGELRQCRDGYRHYRPPAVPKMACLYSGACTCKRYRSLPHL